MFEHVSGITIKGRCFNSEEQLDFFPNQSDRLALVYGKNGSGKTTCAKAFSLCAGNNFSGLEASLFDKGNKTKLTQPENGWSNIFVFDEEYINTNLRINGEGLGSIVLFGEQVEIDTELKKLDEDKKNVQANLAKSSESLNNKYESPASPLSPVFYKNKIFYALKKNDGWASVDSKIKENKVNSPVSDDLFNEFRQMDVKTSLDELKVAFKEKMQLYVQSRGDTIQYPHPIPTQKSFSDTDLIIINLLKKEIQKPELSDRDKRILEVVTSGNHHIEESRKTFSDAAVSFCPYCFQSITPEYKNALLTSIANVFNHEADEHKTNLQTAHLSTIEDDFSQYSNLSKDLTLQLVAQCKKCNQIIEKYNGFIDKKINNIYSPLETESLGYAAAMETLNSLLGDLERRRQQLHEARRQRDDLRNLLILLNKQIARKELESDFINFEKYTQEKSNAEKNYNELREQNEKIEKQHDELEQRKANIFIAVDRINHDLQYVFFAENRICIEVVNNQYILKICGKQVKPQEVSCGERNAIALCYFFTKILHQTKVADAYSQEKLIVIDDPVSSFDIGNRIGITSYLKFQIQNTIGGNNNSKVIVLSHDVTSVWNIEKAFQEISEYTKQNAHITNATYCAHELIDMKLDSFKSKKKNEYSKFICDIYSYAYDKTGESLSIGNIMRRMLETFSTFLYKKSIDNLSCDTTILSHLKTKSDFFQNFMYRLVLHGESHTEETVRADNDALVFFSYTSDDEKQKTARYILCMMYLLQKDHLITHLIEAAGAEQEITNWLKSIPDNAKERQQP